VVGAFAGYVVLVGGDGLPMYRFFAPIGGLGFLLLGCGADGLVRRVGGGRPAVGVAAAFLGLAGVWTLRPAFAGPDHAYVLQDLREVEAWKEVGRWFGSHAAPGDSIAVVPAGAVPYFSGLRTIDMLGLNDLTIAHRKVPGAGSGQAGHEKHDAAYVLGRRPTYILLGVYGLTPALRPPQELVQPYYPAEVELLSAPQFAYLYALSYARTTRGYFYYFARRPG
jgi:hypothetical protein